MTPTAPAPTHDTPIARFARSATVSGYCYRCGVPWHLTEGYHATWYTEYRACFPLCEPCWALLGSPEARILYYGMLLDMWEAWEAYDDPHRPADVPRITAAEQRERRRQVMAAVAAGR